MARGPCGQDLGAGRGRNVSIWFHVATAVELTIAVVKGASLNPAANESADCAARS